ncbi:MAG: prolyl aminopeptidase [Methylobacter sp.]|nr:prolyl aminopeptidase [Methylobacter sp.]
MKTLYPEIQPHHTFFLETGSKHSVYVELSGNPDGFPVIFLHGGPCSGTKPDHRRFFNPEFYRIILFDQRGCGQSLPFGELEDNTTGDLIDDMERIRQQLGIDRWLVFGGSWGATLALLYAQKHKNPVAGLIIRGVFLARRMDLDWFAKDGANRIYPEQWQRLVESIPEQQRENLLQGVSQALWGEDEVTRLRVAKEWTAWNGQVAMGNNFERNNCQPAAQNGNTADKLVKQVRMEVHYAMNNYFIEENRILENCGGLSGIPAIIIHGRNDLVCPIEAAMKLHQALPDAEYIILPNAGHVAQNEEMIDALISATDKFAEKLI